MLIVQIACGATLSIKVVQKNQSLQVEDISVCGRGSYKEAMAHYIRCRDGSRNSGELKEVDESKG